MPEGPSVRRTARQSQHLKKRFLVEFGEVGVITRAADAVGIDRNTVYYWQEHDDGFAQAFRQAEIRSTEVLETEARRRAVEGVEKQRRVYDNRGNLVDEYVETSYSDTLLIFLLKARAPEKYRDRHDITSGGQPLTTAHADLDHAITERLAQMVAGGKGAGALVDDSTGEPEDS
jgi:hypothetical protein